MFSLRPHQTTKSNKTSHRWGRRPQPNAKSQWIFISFYNPHTKSIAWFEYQKITSVLQRLSHTFFLKMSVSTCFSQRLSHIFFLTSFAQRNAHNFIYTISLSLRFPHNITLPTSHSARRPRTLSGRPTVGPYESFQDVLIRRGRRKDVAATSRPNRT